MARFVRFGVRTIAVAALASFALSVFADEDHFVGDMQAERAELDQKCSRLAEAQPPQSDMPSKELADSLSNCDPEDLYYSTLSGGHPTTADWAPVRACAFAQGSDVVLMMLYANGFGVKKSRPLALKYACGPAGAAMAEIKGRLAHITAMNMDSDVIFDQCDDITRGASFAHCAQIAERQEEKRRAQRLAEISSPWSAAQKSEFEKLRKSAMAFADAHANNEIDRSGTAQGEFVAEAQGAEKDLFVHDIEQFEKNELPSFTHTEFAALDRELNQAYQNIMHARTDGPGDYLELTTTTKKDVREVQRLWLKFRDAWASFGQSRYPTVSRDSWMAYFTQRRVKQLKAILEPDEEH